MSLLVWDSSSLISLGDNCLNKVVEKLAEEHKLFITRGVVAEIVEHPFHTKLFKYKALLLKHLIDEGVLRIVDDGEVQRKADELINLTNSLMEYKGKRVKIVQRGEAEAMAAYKLLKADALFVDERTTRHLIEDPVKVRDYMQNRTGYKVSMDKDVLREIKIELSDINVLRSTEVIAFAYEKGWLDECMGKTCLEAALYAAKFAGCSITKEEISEYVRMLG